MITKKKHRIIMVDMTCSLIHHGHVRLINKASKFGKVYVGLTKDIDVIKKKRFVPEIKFKYRKEILENIKNVEKVIPSNFEITEKFLLKNKVDILVQGSDYKKKRKFNKIQVVTFPRTKNISSTKIRKLAKKNVEKK